MRLRIHTHFIHENKLQNLSYFYCKMISFNYSWGQPSLERQNDIYTGNPKGHPLPIRHGK